ncbi:MMPL family transporter [Austwickia chelonae]|uniref:MMPL family transporter n=1 Tax=Austwickia chelonae TaxID=100225 RepID=UPI000E24CB7C|nr:MMPL family transporter [Austwickia chelonae]
MAQYARLVVVLWLVVSALCYAGATGALGAPSLFSRLHQAEPFVPKESHEGSTLLERAKDTGPNILIRVEGARSTEPATLEAGSRLQEKFATTKYVTRATSPFVVPGGARTPQTDGLFAQDREDSFMMVLVVDRALSQTQRLDLARESRQQAQDAFAAVPGAKVTLGGGITFLEDITTQIQTDLAKGEGIALPLSLIVMVFVFGGFLAAGLPIVGALASIAGGLASLWAFSFVTELDATVVNITTLLGLALCIDYGLLIVSRFREEVRRLAPETDHAQLDREHLVEATAQTVNTAGRTVFFSALIVAISLAGLTVFPAPVIRAVGLAGVTVVLVALAVAMTLVPALCFLGGRRLVRRRSDDSPDEGLFARLARFVARTYIPMVVAATALLLALAWPVLGMRQVSSSTELLPAGSTERQFIEGVRRDFPMLSEPAAVVVARATPEQLDTYGRDVVSRIAGVSSVDPARPIDDQYSALGVRAKGAATENDQGKNIVTSLRSERPVFQTWVTGSDAQLADYLDAIRERAPWAAGIVATATMVLMFLMTGSLALPLKALIFNVLSLGASLGILTWIFQEGHLQEVLGFTSTHGVESVTPVILLAFGFGLAMDYELFLLSRIVELHEQGYDDERAVELGLQRSGRIITSAALLILIVLAGLAMAKMLIVKQIGVGLAISVVLDATVVRMLLVPATMHLLGRWNWWAPGPLRRWHQKHAIKH